MPQADGHIRSKGKMAQLVKTINSVAIASCKTVQGVAIASVKSILGVDNTGSGYLVNQNFEGSGYDNGETWTPTGTVDPDYTGLILRGSQSLRVSTDGFTDSPTFAAQSECWVFFEFQSAARPSAGDNGRIAFVFNSVPATLCALEYNGDGEFKLHANGGSSAASATSTANGTHWYGWLHWLSGGTCEAFVSTATTRPGTGDDGVSNQVYLSRTGASGNAVQIRLSSGAGGDITFDHALVSTAAIGNNP
jgi:hypothetical protein